MLRKPGTILIIILTVVAAFIMPSAGAMQESVLDKGIRLLAEGHFNEALAVFHQHKQIAAADARAYFYAGMALGELGRWNAAALELDEALRLDPQQPQYIIFQANVFSRLKQNDQAYDLLSSLGERLARPQIETAWLWLVSDTYHRIERYDEALKILDLLSRRTPNDPRVDLLRGQTYFNKEDYDRALASFQKALAKQPQYAPALYEAGKIHYQRNELEAAQKALREAARLDPRQPDYALKLGQVCLALDQPDEAIKHLLAIEKAHPELVQTYYILGGAFHRKGDTAKAAAYRRKFQELNLQQRKQQEIEEEVSRMIAQAEKQLDAGQDAAARELFEKAIELEPNTWDAQAYLAEMLLAGPDWRRAQPHLARMEALEPESPVGNYLLARYWYLSHEFEKARNYAEKVKLVRPAHAELRNLIGGIYAALGQKEKALAELETAVRLAPDRAEYRENLQKLKERHQQ